MDEARRYIPNHQSELDQIVQEAQHRWLRPAEICEILRNYKRFNLRPDPPVQPPAGSLFLFDRKALRYFRNDGHRWRKKKDGKTVKEAHEKLKAGSVNVLHCYYAHGEDNDNFQRRSYWMLDGQLEHIVLVHYREVKEGYKSGISRLPVDPGSQIGSPQSSSAPCFSQANSPAPTVQTSYSSSPNKVGWSGQTLSSEFEDVDSGDGPVPFSRALVQSIYGSMSHNASLPAHQVLGLPGSSSDHSDSWFAAAKFDPGTGSSVWTNIQTPSRNVDSLHETKFHVDKKLYVEQPSGADFLTHKLTGARLDLESEFRGVVTCGDRLITDDVQAVPSSSERLVQAPQEHGFDILRPYFQNYSGPQTVIASATQVENKSGLCDANNDESGGLKKLDSFGRWMDKEIGRDCDDSLMASDSGNYWNALDTENDDKEVSSLSRQMQLDIDSLAPSLSQEQLFSICDFSPDWAYYGVETKVLIVGTFLGSKKPSTGNKWGCMFGEFEVSAEVLTNTTIRCQAPLHAPGRVPFYVTCSNRLACSEVREFEYREKPARIAYSMAVISAPEEEVRFQTRLAKLLYLGPERMWSDCSVESCDKCKLKTAIYSMSNRKNDWKTVEGTSMAVEADHINSRDILIENMLKDRLPLWLAYKVHERGKGPHILDDEGQGVIHLAAALGYEWAMGPIVAAGVNPNFRDARGRTGLHWASYFGREEMVITLIRLGAAPGAVDDPTPAFPGGQKAADLASSRGNKGIAGYLAEADLINHLSSMSVNENVMSGVAANIAAEKAIETATEVVLSSGSLNEDVSLKGSLAAVRKSAYAAALIQDAFRARSFHQRQLTVSTDDSSEPSLDLVALGFLNKVRKGNYEDYLHSAAVKIQQKYRGWKGRKEFLKIRNRIVKIQAHVRGHQVRKHYKKVVWSVGIMEKLILRWRRKGTGLRGFRGEKATGNMVPETKKTDEYEFLRIGRKQKFAGFEKALARVKSMVRDPEAREQYMRMATKFENLKMGDEGSSSVSKQVQTSQKSRTEEDLAIFTVAKKPG